MSKLLSSLIVLLLALVILAVGALILVPRQVTELWAAYALPPEPLNRALALVRRAAVRPDNSVRLYGTLEAPESFAMSEIEGRVSSILVEEGQYVEAGTPLLELDPTIIAGEVAAAEEAVQTARAARQAAAEPPSPTQIAVADSAVAAAETRLQNAQRSLEDARKTLKEQQALTAQIHQIEALIPAAEAAVSRAEAGVKQADILLESVRGDGSREGQFQQAMYERQKAAAQAEVEAAKANLAGLKRSLTLLRRMRRNPLADLARVHQAEYEVRLAEAALAVARAERDVAAAPPSKETIAVADAQVLKAEAALDLTRWQLEHLTVRAPMSGRILARMVEPGETVRPGLPLFDIANLETMEVQVYVALQDLPRIRLGDELPVIIEALPERSFRGTVFYIAPEAQFRPSNVLNPDDRGDMVFLVKLRIANPDGVLKPGMPADVLLK
ncbi:MAG: HlyD family efflux transporter periplasmic adaptor subunit [Caldilineae bacterium]|nr:MAG: HlyD family efflux transporter periplasmic adaptor subunit [Caldilineae bacterium]